MKNVTFNQTHTENVTLPRHGFGNDSCKLKTTLSTKRLILLPSAPRTYNSQSCVNPSGDFLLFSDAAWPISKTTLIRILLQQQQQQSYVNHEKKTKKEKGGEEKKNNQQTKTLKMATTTTTNELNATK